MPDVSTYTITCADLESSFDTAGHSEKDCGLGRANVMTIVTFNEEEIRVL